MVNPLGVLPTKLKERLYDATIEGLARVADKVPGDWSATAIRKLKSDASFQKSFNQAVHAAVTRFHDEYGQIDQALMGRLTLDQQFWSSKLLADSLQTIASKPGNSGREERAKLWDEFQRLVGHDIDTSRIDDAVEYFLRCLSEQVWTISELIPIYTLYMNRMTAENTRVTAEHTISMANDMRSIRTALSNTMSLQRSITAAAQGDLPRELEAAQSTENSNDSTDQSATFEVQTENSGLLQYRLWIDITTSVMDIRDIGNTGPGHGVSFELDSLCLPLHVRAGPGNYDPDQPRTRLDDVVDSTRCVLVTADSGSGKSTFLRHLCRTYIHDERGLMPVLVELVDMSDEDLKPADRRKISPDLLANAALRRLEGEGLSINATDLIEHADRGQVIWLIDGLNELASTDTRESAVNLINVAVRRWRDCKFVVTSTGAAVRGTSFPLGFDLAEVDEWRPEDIETFLDAWASEIYPEVSPDQRRERWEPLLTAILNTPELRSLAKNALNVTSMAVVHFYEHRLPEGRADLLGAVTSWLINRRRHVLQRSGYTSKQIDRAFLELAYYMATAEKGPLKKVGKMWASQKTQHIFDGDQDKSTEFYETAVTIGGLIVAKPPGDLTFWNDSLRDYLAAKYIAGKTDDIDSGWWSEISQRLDDPSWNLIVSLVPGCLGSLGTDRVDLFFERLGTSCTNQALETRARRVALGGRVLRELYPSGYRSKDVPAWCGAVSGISQLFSQRTNIDLMTRYEASVAFGFEGDARLTEEATVWIWIPNGSFLMGAQASDAQLPNYDRDAAAWESPVVEKVVGSFGMRRFPITVGEYRDFLDDHGYDQAGSNHWSADGLRWRDANAINGPLGWEDQVLVPNTPITGVSWFEAEAYCSWASSRSQDYNVGLPTEAEWEYAARWSIAAGKQFPWGDRMTFGEHAEANWAGCYLRRKTPVGMFPLSTTRSGLADLFGNVEEWCLDLWSWEGDDPLLRGDSNFLDNHTALFPTTGMQRVVRGGSTIRFSRLCRPSYRTRILQEGRYLTVGFRPVRRTK